MSKVLSFLNANQIVVSKLPGMCLFPDDIGRIAARAAMTFEIEQENMAYEEHHIQLRFTLFEDPELETAVGKLEVVRVSIEHGDAKAVPVAIAHDLETLKANFHAVCVQFECYQHSPEHAYGMLADIQEILHVIEPSDLSLKAA